MRAFLPGVLLFYVCHSFAQTAPDTLRWGKEITIHYGKDSSVSFDEQSRIMVRSVMYKDRSQLITTAYFYITLPLRTYSGDTILKKETCFYREKKDHIEKLYYINGDTESGIEGRYFGHFYRKKTWERRNKDGVLVASGRYKRFIIVRKHIFCSTGLQRDRKNGEWKFYNDQGVVKKTETYRNGAFLSTKYL
jgi:antitoxin component YwqK of YwqJK toxin-antitoxin module